VTGKSIATAEVTAKNKDDLLLDIPKLAAPIRTALGDSTPESVQLAAAQGSFATSNIEAVHYYTVGMEQQFEGKLEDALKSFSKAVELDPNFARAYAGMAGTYGNLDQATKRRKIRETGVTTFRPPDRPRTLSGARPVLHQNSELAAVH